MFSRISKGLVLGLSLAATTVAVGCAGSSDENVGSSEGAATSSIAHDYEGSIGNNKVYVRINRVGEAITGSYFYDKVGTTDDVLMLKGTLKSGTKLTMTESLNSAGADTGAFDVQVAGDSITGTWKAGNTALPVKLTAIKAFKAVQHKYSASIKAVKENEDSWVRDCSLEAEAVEIFGMEPAAEKAIMDKLKIDRLERDEEGHCENDIRWVTQTIVFNEKGFLTVDVSSEYDGGAHPNNSSEYYNFDGSGYSITPSDIFEASSSLQLKALVVKAMLAEAGPEGAEDIKGDIELLDQYWDADTKLDGIQMGVLADGIKIDMINNYPHVALPSAPVVTLKWADVKPLISTWTSIQSLTE
jgi:hypothetical protein